MASVIPSEKPYENIYTGLILQDNDVYGTLHQKTQDTQQAQNRGITRHGCAPCKVAAMSLGLLCAILVTIIIILSLSYVAEVPDTCDTGNCSLIQRKLEFLEASNRNLTEKGRLLQREKEKVEKERSALQKNLSNTLKEVMKMEKEKSQFQMKVVELQKRVADLTDRMVNGKQCPQDFLQFKTSCYYFSSEKKSWADSRADCVARGANLVIIDSKMEEEFLHNHCRSQYYWIGLTDLAKEGTWVWVDGSPLRVGYWADGEPNSYQGKNEDCVHGFNKPEALKSWNDCECWEAWYWICESKPK